MGLFFCTQLKHTAAIIIILIIILIIQLCQSPIYSNTTLYLVSSQAGSK